MIPNLFILSGSGEVLIEKHWRGKVKRNICEVFWEEASKATGSKKEAKSEVLPIICTPKYYLVHVLRSDLTFLSAVSKETTPLMIFEELHKMIEIFVGYWSTSLTETLVRENFSTIYQLLDEMVDGGCPFTTESNQVRSK
jgi:AP-3 complex subunit mu